MAQRTLPRRCSTCPATVSSVAEALKNGWVGGGRRPWTCCGCLGALRQKQLEERLRRAEASARLMAGPMGIIFAVATTVR